MDIPEANTPGTAGNVATSSAEPVRGSRTSLEREGDLGSPSGGRPPQRRSADRPAWLQASRRAPSLTAGGFDLLCCLKEEEARWGAAELGTGQQWATSPERPPIPPGAPHRASSTRAQSGQVKGVVSPVLSHSWPGRWLGRGTRPFLKKSRMRR